LSLLVHVVFLGILIFSFNWKAVQPANIAQVELWDSIPVVQEKPVVKPEPPKPEPRPEPRPEPKPEPKPEPPKPESVPEPKAVIQVKKEPEKPKPVEKPKEKPKEKPPEKKVEKKPEPDPLAELKKQMLEEQMELRPQPAPAAPSPSPAESAAMQGEVDKYISAISRKIRQNVNRQVCGTGKPELELEISLMPTGEVIGTPRLLKGSGLSACDDAVVRAVLQSQPLPVPTEANLFARFRDLRLKFRPNDN
jgi:colicin import membrane protein